MITALEGEEGSASRPARSLPPGKDPRTAQPVANRYTDYTTRPTGTMYATENISIKDVLRSVFPKDKLLTLPLEPTSVLLAKRLKVKYMFLYHFRSNTIWKLVI